MPRPGQDAQLRHPRPERARVHAEHHGGASRILTSTIGYSRIAIENSDGQRAAAFRTGQYALANIVYHPAPGLLAGPELQWGRRQNFADGWAAHDVRIQFSVRYDFDVPARR